MSLTLHISLNIMIHSSHTDLDIESWQINRTIYPISSSLNITRLYFLLYRLGRCGAQYPNPRTSTSSSGLDCTRINRRQRIELRLENLQWQSPTLIFTDPPCILTPIGVAQRSPQYLLGQKFELMQPSSTNGSLT